MNEWRITHTLIPAPFGERSTFFAGPGQSDRLVVFVHGFRGNATKTWGRFAENLGNALWWHYSDLLFFGYNSTRRSVPGVAQELREILDTMYPRPAQLLREFELDGEPPEGLQPYSELVLVGHSLGGVILRRMLVDAAADFARGTRKGFEPEIPAILTAKLRLFAPANAGFSPSGVLGSMQSLSPWVAIEAWMRRSPAYNDLRHGTTALATLREETESLAAEPGNEALRAEILWPDPDDVVSTESYRTDESERFVRDKTHRSVCRPDESYLRPWEFVSGGAE